MAFGRCCDVDPWQDEDGTVLELVLSKLEGVRHSAGRWMAKCPAHDDGRASLQITRGTSQPVLLKCFAECDYEAVLTALGLTPEDVCAPRERDAGEWTPRGIAIAIYHYRDENRKLLFDVCRTESKDFPLRVPDPAAKSGYRWRLGDTRRVLYRLPELIAAVDGGEVIWICEGEKDVERLRAEGVAATCNPGGAGKWLAEYAEFFAGAAVCIIADCDAPGRAHARAVARSLEPVAAAVDILEPAVGKDVSDHLAAGKTLTELHVTKHDASDPLAGMPLLRFLAMPEEPEQWVIKGLLERADRLILTGGEGAGKSTLVRQIGICAAAGIHPFTGEVGVPVKVMMVDCENAERKSRRRFRPLAQVAANAGRPLTEEGFVIYHLPRGIDLTKDEWSCFLLEQVTAHRPGLLCVGPLYKLHAVDANEEQAARVITEVLDHAIEISDCALVTEAHMAKGSLGVARRLEPAGSRLFLGWPDQGYGLRVNGERRRVSMVPWRGDREERDWPGELMWGRGHLDWPWVIPSQEHVPPPAAPPAPPKTGPPRLPYRPGDDPPALGGLDFSHPDP